MGVGVIFGCGVIGGVVGTGLALPWRVGLGVGVIVGAGMARGTAGTGVRAGDSGAAARGATGGETSVTTGGAGGGVGGVRSRAARRISAHSLRCWAGVGSYPYRADFPIELIRASREHHE